MIRENQKLLNNLQIFTDAVIIPISIILAYLIRFGLLYKGTEGYLPLTFYLRLVAIIVPLYLGLYSVFGLYEPYRKKSISTEIFNIIKANVTGLILILTGLFIFKEIHVSRLVVMIFFTVNSLMLSLDRTVLRKILRNLRRSGKNIKYMLIVGSGKQALDFYNSINRRKELGYSVWGYLDSQKGDYFGDVLRYLGGIGELSAILEQNLIDEVVIALDNNDFEAVGKIIEMCEKTGTKSSLIPYYSKYIPARPYIDEIDGIPLINLRRIPLDNFLNAFIKRAFDIFCSFILIVLLSPLLLVTALLVKLSSEGPVIYRQVRVGLSKKPFEMYKFRSMRMAKDGEDKTAWTTANDPRRTRFGAFIRKFSIDELPQLFNVFLGDMSLVGPRPEIPHFVDHFKEEIPLYMIKHQVRPGITGWAQVNGLRGDTSIVDRIRHDIYYIENWSFAFDIRILFLTAFKGIISNETI